MKKGLRKQVLHQFLRRRKGRERRSEVVNGRSEGMAVKSACGQVDDRVTNILTKSRITPLHSRKSRIWH